MKNIKVEFNHHILLAREKKKTAELLTFLFDLPDPIPADGPMPEFFLCINFKNNVTLLVAEAKEHSIAHYAFKVPQEDFDQVITKLEDLNIKYWADPRMEKPSEIYMENGNRGLYFIDPSGHGMEILSEIP
jgi:hypothetical protein